MIELLRINMQNCNILKCKKLCCPHATGPMSDQAGQRPAENIIPFIVRLDMSPQKRLPIGSVDVNFLAKQSPASVILWNLPK